MVFLTIKFVIWCLNFFFVGGLDWSKIDLKTPIILTQNLLDWMRADYKAYKS